MDLSLRTCGVGESETGHHFPLTCRHSRLYYILCPDIPAPNAAGISGLPSGVIFRVQQTRK